METLTSAITWLLLVWAVATFFIGLAVEAYLGYLITQDWLEKRRYMQGQ